ncbi:MAG: hypothetical protein GXP63_01680 [DPANN group archaeon]|nr:hypothetical protein [DPANN group archaeon]
MENATSTPIPEKKQEQGIIGLHTIVRKELAKLGYRGFKGLFPENGSIVGDVLLTDGRSYGLASVTIHLYGSKEHPVELLYLSSLKNLGSDPQPEYVQDIPLDEDAYIALLENHSVVAVAQEDPASGKVVFRPSYRATG